MKTQASLTVSPGGESERTMLDANVLKTDFDEVFIGGHAELGEMDNHFYHITESLQKEQEFSDMAASVNTAIYYYTKNAVTYILLVLAGPILAVCWAIIVAVIKFCVSWVIVPTIKVVWMVSEPCRALVKVLLLPAEPLFELIGNVFPKVNVSLLSIKDDDDSESSVKIT